MLDLQTRPFQPYLSETAHAQYNCVLVLVFILYRSPDLMKLLLSVSIAWCRSLPYNFIQDNHGGGKIILNLSTINFTQVCSIPLILPLHCIVDTGPIYTLLHNYKASLPNFHWGTWERGYSSVIQVRKATAEILPLYKLRCYHCILLHKIVMHNVQY